MFLELVDENHCIIDSTIGYHYYLRLMSNIDRELLTPSALVCIKPFSDSVVEVLPTTSISSISPLGRDKIPDITYNMDGFDEPVNVKVIMATNRADTLDPALVRPGRVDRVIEFPLPDIRQKRLIFQACMAKMSLSNEVDLEDYASRPDKISPAEIDAICREAGMLAIRKSRYVILTRDFEKAYRSIVKRPDNDFEFYH